MCPHKTKSTQRKFYNKWLYKTCFDIDGCTLLRSESVAAVQQFLSSPLPAHVRYVSWRKAHDNNAVMLKLCDFLLLHAKDTYALRIENSRLDVYTNDRTFYDQIGQLLDTQLVHRFEPTDHIIAVLNAAPNIIAVPKLPKDRYRHRVYLLPHKMARDKAGKQRYLAWIKSQAPRITCTPALERWFVSTEWNWDRRYVLVEDEATLLMLKLRNAEVMGRVYNFVISDK